MPVWAWILIAIVVVAAVGVAVWMVGSKRRTGILRGQFGPEYDRALAERGDRRRAESELAARRKRRAELDIRPLDPEARRRYAEQWREVQVRFVDAPGRAVTEADRLVSTVMRDRGYPVEDFERRADLVSVDHPTVVHEYRAAHGISLANDNGRASTEDLREALLHYRALFNELLGAERVETAEPVAGVVEVGRDVDVPRDEPGGRDLDAGPDEPVERGEDAEKAELPERDQREETG
jgi:hypothetical protein